MPMTSRCIPLSSLPLLPQVEPSDASECTGFWVGVVLWLLNAWTTLFTYDYNLVTGLALGSLASGVSYVFSVVIDDNGIKLERSKNDEAQKTTSSCSSL